MCAPTLTLPRKRGRERTSAMAALHHDKSPSPSRVALGEALAVEPLRDHGGDGGAVFLDHHHVAVAVHANIGEADLGVGHAGLREVGGGAVIVGRVIGRLAGDDHDRHMRQVRQLAGRLLLQPAAHIIRLVGLVLAHEFELGVARERRIIGERHVGEAGNLGALGILEPVGRAGVLDVVHGRPGRLDRDEGLEQFRPRVGDRPVERARLRMGEQDRGPDLVEQGRERIAVEFLLAWEARERGELRGVELVEGRIARLPLAWPLRVQPRLRPLHRAFGRNEAPLDEVDARRRQRAVRLRWPISRAAARDLVDHVHRVAAAHEILRPAFAPVRRAGEIGAGLAAAVHHNDRERMRAARRDHLLDIHLAEHGTAFGRGVDLAADEEIARAREHERPALLCVSRWYRDERCQRERGCRRCSSGCDHRMPPFVFRT